MANDKLGSPHATNVSESKSTLYGRDRGRPVRRRPHVTIDTERRLGDGLITAGGVQAGAAAHIAHQRDRRTRKGDIFLRRCAVIFLFSLTGVLKMRQYTSAYYVCWIFTYLSFFFMLPSVLPTDNAKIRVMLAVTGWNMLCAFALATRFAARKWAELDACDLDPWLCVFNISFWVAHASLALFYCLSAVYAVGWMAHAAALHKFWRSTGWYFTFVSSVTALDLAVACRAGKYRLPQYTVAFYGNAAINIVQFTIGRLCHSARFKNAMWSYAASIASINVRPRQNRAVDFSSLLCCDLRCFIPSAILFFVLALLTQRHRNVEAVWP